MFNKPYAVIFIERDSVVLLTKKTKIKLELPPEVVQNLEVIDAMKLAELVERLLRTNKIHKKKLLLVLDDSVVFQEALPLSKDTNLQNMVKDFESKIPLEVDSKQVLALGQKERLVLFGVNKQLYQAIIAGLDKTSNKPLAVVPAAIYGVNAGNKFTLPAINRYFRDSKPLRLANLAMLA